LLKWTTLLIFGLLIGNITFLIVLDSNYNVLMYFSIFIVLGVFISASTHYLLKLLQIRFRLNMIMSSLLETFKNADMDAIYKKALEDLTGLIECEYGSIAISEGKQYKILSTFENDKYELVNYIVKIREVEVLDLLQTKPILFQNWNKDRPMGSLEHRFFEEGVRSSICIPIIYHSEVIACINLATRRPYHFTRTQIHLIKQVVPIISFGLSLIDSETRFTTVTQSTQDAIILTDGQMRITSWNKGAENVFGYLKEDVLGKNIELIIPHEYRDAHTRGIERFFREGSMHVIGKTLNLEGLRKDNRIIPIELTVNKWTMGSTIFFSSIIRDISERKKTETALKESEERYRKLVELSPDGLCVYQDHKVVFANERAASIIGVKSTDMLLGKNTSELLPYEKHDEIERLINRLLKRKGTTSSFEIDIQNEEKETISIEVSTSYIQYDGNPAIMATFRDITERKRMEKKLKEANVLLERLSNLDGLTGIPNRRYFDDTFEKEWVLASANHSPLSVLLCDVDYFKEFNDTYGHQTGDQCLISIAHSFQEVLKKPHDFSARYGGEEFVVLLPDTDGATAQMVAEKIRNNVIQLSIPHSTSKISSKVSISIGIATGIPSSLLTSDHLLEQADKALYRAKHEGRNKTLAYQSMILKA
jgi:diguanylate cyclase (GGDEF)-like protein/PAS domain S-box-containing protein